MMSDVLVVPTTPDFLSINALGRFLEDLEEVGGAPYKVLLTMVPWYERLHCPGRVELEGAGVPLFERQIQERKAFRHAANEGLPVYGVRRTGARVGKSKDPAYKLGSAYVLKSIHDQVMAELLRPDVRALLIRQFGRFGVQYMPKKAAYSDLVELLLRRWLEGLEEELEEEA